MIFLYFSKIFNLSKKRKKQKNPRKSSLSTCAIRVREKQVFSCS